MQQEHGVTELNEVSWKHYTPMARKESMATTQNHFYEECQQQTVPCSFRSTIVEACTKQEEWCHKDITEAIPVQPSERRESRPIPKNQVQPRFLLLPRPDKDSSINMSHGQGGADNEPRHRHNCPLLAVKAPDRVVA